MYNNYVDNKILTLTFSTIIDNLNYLNLLIVTLNASKPSQVCFQVNTY